MSETTMAASQAQTETPSPSIYIPDSWSQAADSIANGSTSPPPIALVCGPPNSGKTNFSRILLNTLLQRYKKVAYLDTDVGQSEFTPPGCLSLIVIDKLIPDLTIPCLKVPERCFFFGDASSKRDPKTYLKYIFALYDHFRTVHYMSHDSENLGKHKLPLVVNTSGWVKGLGYDMLVQMLQYIAPTHVVKICISAESKNLPPGIFWLDSDHDGLVKLIELHAAQQDSYNRSVLKQKEARLIRDLRLIAYFRQCLPRDFDISSFKEFSHALTSHPPYGMRRSSVEIAHIYCQVPISEVLPSSNASIVGLAISSEKSSSSECCAPWCVGLGIIKGVDVSKDLLYVLTPVPLSILGKVDLLLQGLIPIPPSLLQGEGCMSPYMSENVPSTS